MANKEREKKKEKKKRTKCDGDAGANRVRQCKAPSDELKCRVGQEDCCGNCCQMRRMPLVVWRYQSISQGVLIEDAVSPSILFFVVTTMSIHWY